ncbi:hypothetical protein P7C71_g619, partial [Lecanoromycetidae sp. Uapishka_2]
MSLLHRYKGNHNQLDLTDIASGEAHPPPSTSKAPRRRSSGLKFFASAATPKTEPAQASHKAWEASYLKDLRANRPARPGGSRPLPDRASPSTPEPYTRAASALSFRPSCSTRQPEPYDRSVSALSHRRAQSDMPTLSPQREASGGNGQHTVPQIKAVVASRDFTISTMSAKQSSVIPSGTYRESGMRWIEKQEARSLREALEDMDLRDDAKIHAAAQDEASELVLSHRTSGMPFKSPYQPYNYKAHLEKGAHARSQSLGWYTERNATTNSHIPGQRSTSDGSNSSNNESSKSPIGQISSTATAKPFTNNFESQIGGGSGHTLWDSPHKKAYMSLTSSEPLSKRSSRRRSSGARARHVSGGLFRNPDDKIYEEPNSAKKESEPIKSYEITTDEDKVDEDRPSTRDGREIRSDDIRAATTLECVAFYPEPDTARSARLARIEARAASNYTDVSDEKPGETASEDGDASLRFYCHLDFHELFSPRCRSCKTPIETEVVLACGGSWHVGHFFCAECGDPFDAKTPFVEKDGGEDEKPVCVGCEERRLKA